MDASDSAMLQCFFAKHTLFPTVMCHQCNGTDKVMKNGFNEPYAVSEVEEKDRMEHLL